MSLKNVLLYVPVAHARIHFRFQSVHLTIAVEAVDAQTLVLGMNSRLYSIR